MPLKTFRWQISTKFVRLFLRSIIYWRIHCQGERERGWEERAATASSGRARTGCRLQGRGQVGDRKRNQEDERGRGRRRSMAGKGSSFSERVGDGAIYWDGKLGKEQVLGVGWARSRILFWTC